MQCSPDPDALEAQNWIALVRHGAPRVDANEQSHAWHLSSSGEHAVRELARQLERFQASPVVCSPETRARETAQILRPRGDMRIDEDLAEHGRGYVPMLSAEAFERAIKEFFDTPHSAVLGAESADDAAKRMDRALKRLGGATAIVVSHGRIISAYVSELLGVHGLQIWQALRMPDVLLVDPAARSVRRLSPPGSADRPQR